MWTLIAWGVGLVAVLLFLKVGARGSETRDLDAGTIWRAAREAEQAGTYTPVPRLRPEHRSMCPWRRK